MNSKEINGGIIIIVLFGSKRENQSAMPSNAAELETKKGNHFLNANNLPRKRN